MIDTITLLKDLVSWLKTRSQEECDALCDSPQVNSLLIHTGAINAYRVAVLHVQQLIQEVHNGN